MLNTNKIKRLTRLRSAAEIAVPLKRQLLAQSLPGEWDLLEPAVQARLVASEASLLGLLIRRLLDFSGGTDDLVLALTQRLLALACPLGGWLGSDGRQVDAWGTVAAIAALSRVLDEPSLSPDLAVETQHAVQSALDRLLEIEADKAEALDAAMVAWRLRLLSEADEPADRLGLRSSVDAWFPMVPANDFARLALAHAQAQLRCAPEPVGSF